MTTQETKPETPPEFNTDGMQSGRIQCARPNESAGALRDTPDGYTSGRVLEAISNRLQRVKSVVGVTVYSTGKIPTCACGGEDIEYMALSLCQVVGELSILGQSMDPTRASYGSFSVVVLHWGGCIVAITYESASKYVKSLKRHITNLHKKYDEKKL